MFFQRTVGLLSAVLLATTPDLSAATTYLRRSLQLDRAGDTGDRVSGIDRTGAECIAEGNGATGALEWTEINYYYAIHASAALDQEKEEELESMIYILIQTAILWCTLPETIPIDVDGSNRKLHEFLESVKFNQFKSGHRRLTDEARKLSIIAFNNNPMDETIDNLFTSATTPCQFSNSNVCSMMKGRMGITAHASDNISLIVASILDAIQDVMDLDLLLEPLCGFENPCIVEKVEFWGDTMEDVTAAVDGALSEDDDIIIVVPGGDDDSGGNGNGSDDDGANGATDDDDDRNNGNPGDDDVNGGNGTDDDEPEYSLSDDGIDGGSGSNGETDDGTQGDDDVNGGNGTDDDNTNGGLTDDDDIGGGNGSNGETDDGTQGDDDVNGGNGTDDDNTNGGRTDDDDIGGGNGSQGDDDVNGGNGTDDDNTNGGVTDDDDIEGGNGSNGETDDGTQGDDDVNGGNGTDDDSTNGGLTDDDDIEGGNGSNGETDDGTQGNDDVNGGNGTDDDNTNGGVADDDDIGGGNGSNGGTDDGTQGDDDVNGGNGADDDNTNGGVTDDDIEGGNGSNGETDDGTQGDDDVNGGNGTDDDNTNGGLIDDDDIDGNGSNGNSTDDSPSNGLDDDTVENGGNGTSTENPTVWDDDRLIGTDDDENGGNGTVVIPIDPEFDDDSIGDDGNSTGNSTVPDGAIEEEQNEEDDSPRFLFAAVPLAVLLGFALLVARQKKNRQILTPSDLSNPSDDYVLPGTGDPPRSFHEGMYHYTRSGARYLSTNCPDCYETRKMGNPYSVLDLPTINERHLFDPESGSQDSSSYDEASIVTELEVSEHDPSAHRKQNLVEPTTGNLGQKASTVDVHQCTSATCRICAYNPRDVAFVGTPRAPDVCLPASPDSDMYSVYQTASGTMTLGSKTQDSLLLVDTGSI